MKSVREVLSEGEISVEGRIIDASNASLYVRLTLGEEELNAIYKPIAGERPLWDFPPETLALREVAAYELSEAIGLHVVPVTILRDGPFGLGALQQWCPQDEEFDIVEFGQSDDRRLRLLALFDAIINNTDRKFGHILIEGERVLGCDHGVAFHTDDKLRTVLWQFAGLDFTDEELVVLERASTLDLSNLNELLSSDELAALAERIERLRNQGKFPMPSSDWPAVPWPPF